MRESLERSSPVPPGDVVKVRIDLWATGIRVFPGHRLRLEVASAAVPKFPAHTNTLESPGSAVRAVIAKNRVWHDAEHPSRVMLPVVE
jgi:predicted acyl esterase